LKAGLAAGLAVSGGLSIIAVQLGLIIRLMRQARVRRRADEALRQIPDRYRSVVDSQSELICRLLPDATVTFVNEACCRFWEKRPDELVGRGFADLMPPPARGDGRTARALARGRTVTSIR
jgi:PAS domain-containing protein